MLMVVNRVTTYRYLIVPFGHSLRWISSLYLTLIPTLPIGTGFVALRSELDRCSYQGG
jgi:hypothetical protein